MKRLALLTAAFAFALPLSPAFGQSTDVVSLNSIGDQGNDHNVRSSISDDGRFVAFESEGTNLVDIDGDGVIDPDLNGSGIDIFVHDRETGTTEIVTVNSAGVQANAGHDFRAGGPSKPGKGC